MVACALAALARCPVALRSRRAVRLPVPSAPVPVARRCGAHLPACSVPVRVAIAAARRLIADPPKTRRCPEYDSQLATNSIVPHRGDEVMPSAIGRGSCPADLPLALSASLSQGSPPATRYDQTHSSRYRWGCRMRRREFIAGWEWSQRAAGARAQQSGSP